MLDVYYMILLLFRKKNFLVFWFNIFMFSNRKEIKICIFYIYELLKYNVVKLSIN